MDVESGALPLHPNLGHVSFRVIASRGNDMH